MISRHTMIAWLVPRKVSNKCSGSFFMTAAACFASMLLLAERILQDPTMMQALAPRYGTLWFGYPAMLPV